MPTVTLISHTPDPVRTIAAAAKLCYSKSDIPTLLDNLDDQKAEDFVRMLLSLGHESPLEHVSFTFGIEGVSRAFLAQITRHRIASYSVQSQRYVDMSGFQTVVPPAIAANAEAAAEYARCIEQCRESYQKIAGLLAPQRAAELIAEGVPEKEAHKRADKLAGEDARFVLPNACDTRMVVTMNTRSLYNFFRHRCCNRAQWEIHAVADEMLRLVRGTAPILFEHAGPPCVCGSCPEGKMSCGRAQEMRRRYHPIRSDAAKQA
ncbi:MAG: FAD-dependent thymidylate synthase [Provencibacterium sp.]|jgi:thymidylate synthase (FAD)|nr:FAD-dependent thymidylate synthase [Provencibacterium sp.]